MRKDERPVTDVLVVCSSGGHLFDAVAISPAWKSRTHAWVSFDKADVRSMLGHEQVHFAYGPTNRSIGNLLRNLRLAWGVIRETRPRILITTGAGVGVPFAWVGRLRGACVIYVECAGRVDHPSLSARLIGPAASHVYAQWPDLAASWRRARYAGNVLLAQRDHAPLPSPGSGVLVTVGTNEAPFDRLLRMVGELATDDMNEEIVVQCGSSVMRPRGARSFDYLPFAALDGFIRSARAIVTHAGTGSVAAALGHGKRPVVVARRHRFGEAVDDHQVPFARQLHSAGLASVVDSADQLREVIAEPDHTIPPDSQPHPDLVEEIETLLDRLLSAGNGSRHDSPVSSATRGE